MGIPQEAREAYHPNFDPAGRLEGGKRDFQARLEILRSAVDFTGKRVLDLGCSGGFFTFSLSRHAAFVTGIDADRHLIERNLRLAEELDYGNVDFVCDTITPETLTGLGDYDVVLFLSVLHHMIAGSSTYDWNPRPSGQLPRLLEALREAGDVLIVEMGRTDEGFAWCDELSRKIGEPNCWIPENVFGNAYASLRVLPGPALRRWPVRSCPRLGNLLLGSPVGNRILSAFGIDRRDFREIFVGARDQKLLRPRVDDPAVGAPSGAE